MKSRSETIEQIHFRAQTAVRLYKKCEVDLIEILEEAEKFRVHIARGHSSLFDYATAGLGLSDEVAYIFINVARKATAIPELKNKIREGKISVTKARRISAVLTSENQKHWLELAERLSKRELEKMVAAENPRTAIAEKATYISKDVLQLQVGVSEKTMLQLRRAQDVFSQKKRRPVSLEETLAAMTELFLGKNDPVEKAKRQEARGKLIGARAGQEGGGERQPIPAAIRHKLHIRSGGQCSHRDKSGARCGQRRFVDIHHIRPVSSGGNNDLDNLSLLCHAHHRLRHDKT